MYKEREKENRYHQCSWEQIRFMKAHQVMKEHKLSVHALILHINQNQS